MRTLVWQRWPTTGPAAPVQSAAEYDELVDDLVASGVITDAGMVYFDVRPSNSAPTLELRVCDSCPSVDTIVLIAGLFRALVDREFDALRAGTPRSRCPPPLGRAALWRAARSGLEGDLVDITGPASKPAGEVVTELVRSLRPQLEQSGDWDIVSELTRRALIAGTSAARQRRALRRRGRLTDVVDQLIAETTGRWQGTPPSVVEDPTPAVWIPARRRLRIASPVTMSTSATTKPLTPTAARGRDYREVLDTIARLGVTELRSREGSDRAGSARR